MKLFNKINYLVLIILLIFISNIKIKAATIASEFNSDTGFAECIVQSYNNSYGAFIDGTYDFDINSYLANDLGMSIYCPSYNINNINDIGKLSVDPILVIFNFSDNNITTIEPLVSNSSFTSATSLNFSDNKIESIPSQINLFTALESLNLSNNEITSLPDNFSLPSTITELKLMVIK